MCALWGSLGPHCLSNVTSKWFQCLGLATVRGAGIQGREWPRTFWFDQRAPRRCEGPGGPWATSSHLPLRVLALRRGGAGAWRIPLSICAWRMSGMLMTSVGEPECLLNGIPGGLSQGHWARVSRYTHTWVKPRPAGTHRHAPPATQAPPPASLGWGPTASSSLGSSRGSREVGRSPGAWVRRHLGRERQQAHSSGESGGFFSRQGQGSHAAPSPREPWGLGCTLVLLRSFGHFPGAKGEPSVVPGHVMQWRGGGPSRAGRAEGPAPGSNSSPAVE